MKRNPYKAAIPIVSGIAFEPNPLARDRLPSARRRNPLLRPLPSFAVHVDAVTFEDRYGDEYSEAIVLLHDRSKDGDEALIGGSIVHQGEVPDDLSRWVVRYAAARPGYGPLVYDLAAMAVQSRIFPSEAQSSHAERFWSRQADGVVPLLTTEQFRKKYGSEPPPPVSSPQHRRFVGVLMYAAGSGIPLDRAFRMYNNEWQAASNPLVGFERVAWKPKHPSRSQATFLSSMYPRLWEEALNRTDLKFRVLLVRDVESLRQLSGTLSQIDSTAKKNGEIVLLLLAMDDQSAYALEGMGDEGEGLAEVGAPDRLSRPTPFMLLHNLAEGMIEREIQQVSFSPEDLTRVDTWAGRRRALVDQGNALADLFAKYIITGRVAYDGEDAREVKRSLDHMVDYLRKHPGVYDVLTGHSFPMSARDIASLERIASSQVHSNPEDLAGRHIPERYLEGLPPKLQQQRIRELTASRDAYHRGDFSELPTDVTARKMGLVKESAYTTTAKKRGIEWRGDAEDMAQRTLEYYGARASAGDVQRFADALRLVFKKGLAAWKSGGHRPGATAQNWAVARVNSVVVGGKAAWTADKKQFAVLPDKVKSEIVAQIGDVLANLKKQNRQKDIDYIEGVLGRDNPRRYTRL